MTHRTLKTTRKRYVHDSPGCAVRIATADGNVTHFHQASLVYASNSEEGNTNSWDLLGTTRTTRSTWIGSVTSRMRIKLSNTQAFQSPIKPLTVTKHYRSSYIAPESHSLQDVTACTSNTFFVRQNSWWTPDTSKAKASSPTRKEGNRSPRQSDGKGARSRGSKPSTSNHRRSLDTWNIAPSVSTNTQSVNCQEFFDSRLLNMRALLSDETSLISRTTRHMV